MQDFEPDSYEIMSDEELVSLAKNSNHDACDFLLEKYKSLVRVVTSAYYLAGADRNDILQEGMIGLYKAIQCYSSEHNLKFSVFAEFCIRRQAVSAIKGALRQKHMPLNSYVSLSNGDEDNIINSEIDDMIDGSLLTEFLVDPEKLIIAKENEANFDTKIKGFLSEFERDVLMLFLDGMAYKEIADSMNKDYKAVDNALQRIKKKIKASYYKGAP